MVSRPGENTYYCGKRLSCMGGGKMRKPCEPLWQWNAKDVRWPPARNSGGNIYIKTILLGDKCLLAAVQLEKKRHFPRSVHLLRGGDGGRRQQRRRTSSWADINAAATTPWSADDATMTARNGRTTMPGDASRRQRLAGQQTTVRRTTVYMTLTGRLRKHTHTHNESSQSSTDGNNSNNNNNNKQIKTYGDDKGLEVFTRLFLLSSHGWRSVVVGRRVVVRCVVAAGARVFISFSPFFHPER